MSLENLLFNLEALADLESIRAYESGDFTTETACYYREAVIREAMKRLEQTT
jgi:hypothetical protein